MLVFVRHVRLSRGVYSLTRAWLRLMLAGGSFFFRQSTSGNGLLGIVEDLNLLGPPLRSVGSYASRSLWVGVVGDLVGWLGGWSVADAAAARPKT